VGAAEPPVLPLPDKPSIAVLPFANMSGDPEQEYFADGMVEEIIFSNRHFSGVLDPPPLSEVQRFTRLILAHRHP
jgi:TolB-like protein